MIGDGYLLFVTASVHGVFMMLGISATTGLIGVIVFLSAIDVTLEHLKEKVREGRYPSKEYAGLASLLVGGILIVIPGFCTDAIAVLMYIPPTRRLIGTVIVRPLRGKLKEVYEYLKLSEYR